MRRNAARLSIVLGTCIAALTIVAAAAGGPSKTTDGTQGQGLVPPCSHAIYGANGNMQPLFCVIDNPAALRHFAPMAKRTFALGPDAAPTQVAAALIADYKRGGTVPILCSTYRLAAWRNHWSFGVSPIGEVASRLKFPSGWCREPLFNGIE